MIKLRYAFLLFLFSLSLFAQEQKEIKPADSLPHWTKTNKLGFDISQIAFVNWSAGGNSAISGLLKGDFSRVYAKENQKWANELIFRYGLNKQDGIELRKTDDMFQINSTYGYRKDTITNWYYSAKFNFNTQFTNGYKYPNTEKAISKWFAPAYVFLGIGVENATKSKHRIFYISPLTFKTTLVLNQDLANQGAFGVSKARYDLNGNLIEKGQKSKEEVGFLLTSFYKKEVVKNVIWINRLVLYSDYINRFGNIDVDYDCSFDLVVNKYIRANIGVHILYDDDIKAKEEIAGQQITLGPKMQLKQALGVGLVYAF
jgi:hypothetical protein